MSLNNSSGLLTAYPYCQWPSQGRKSPRFGSFGFQRSLKLQARNRVCSRSSFFLSFSKSGCAQHPSITLRQGSCRNFTGAYICKILSTRGCTRLRRRRSKFSHNVQCEADHGTNNGTVYPNEASNERMKVDENDDYIPSFSLVEEKRRENIYMPNVEVNPLALGGIHEEIWKVGEISIQKKAVPDETRLHDHDLAQEDEQKNSFENEAWELLRASVVNYCGYPVGTIAANDPSNPDRLNYDQVFIRDFIPSGLAFLLNGETEIVRNFLLHTLQLQSWEKTVDCHSPGEGLMPASFKIHSIPLDGDNYDVTEEISEPDFGEAAIGRVAPVDSGLWWIILLRAYGKYTGDYALQERIDVQTGMRLILKLCLADGFDMFPTLLVTDGSCMIDRRMGIHGHPLEIQALFFSALSCAKEMLTPIDNSTHDVIMAINSRLKALCFHIREYYWLDMKKLNQIYRYKTEEYSCDAVNKFNIYPEQIPQWLVDWIPDQGGYLIGNLQPAHMDFRFFSLGNLWSIVGSLATGVQAEGILDLIEHRWNDLVGKMPVKICFPAMEQDEWRIITGSDPKNTPWSYHNGGSWPTLLWQFTIACIKMGRLELARKAVKVAEDRLSSDSWPEYYDTRTARLIGKQAHLYQTWTIAGYLVAKMMLAKPEAASILTCEEDLDLSEATKKCLLMKNLHGARTCIDFLCEGV